MLLNEQAFLAVKQGEDDYVKVDTASSKQRESGFGNPPATGEKSRTQGQQGGYYAPPNVPPRPAYQAHPPPPTYASNPPPPSYVNNPPPPASAPPLPSRPNANATSTHYTAPPGAPPTVPGDKPSTDQEKEDTIQAAYRACKSRSGRNFVTVYNLTDGSDESKRRSGGQ